ncbi:hypothetical protein TraAM80_04732 [Trypanosoma rangeli]|uniref:Uncharacterized protein n=1 Tax=Trypanosoma rangeli TaxID=5698 RepID=A0A3R7KEV8_TRYRA|nr:uncharacterized protein TraAM80_04732 [Trypanosoma rangeli]RNF05086.1 hypothetical protein TraAM80_04732 [Trypanosoma rangeli]|eukprot:RNF05086.1 hypothetical protein TraAM80_04732 [Trypanosoma rangeli]
MSSLASLTAKGAADGSEPLPSPAAATGDKPADDAAVKPQKGYQQLEEESATRLDAKSPTMSMHSALKGRSGRERSTEMKPRFNPEVSVIETPSYAIVMNGEEGEGEDEDEDKGFTVFNRLYEEAKTRLERAKAARDKEGEVEDPDAKECTFSPEVSSYAKQLGKYANFGEFLLSQEQHRNTSAMHFEKKKERLLSDERLDLFEDMPREHSLRIIAYLEKERHYKGPIKGWYERFRAYMKKLQKPDRELTPCKSKTQSDASSVHSGVACDGAVFERLYEDVVVRAISQRIMMMTRLEKEAQELYHPITNESEYWSSESQSSLSSYKQRSDSGSSGNRCLPNRGGQFAAVHRDPSSSVFEELYAMSEEHRRRRELRALEALGNQEELTFRPVTNPRSSKIIMERAIARAKGELPERTTRKQGLRDAEGNDQLEANSQQRRRNIRFHPDIFCSRLQRKESERMRRLAALQRRLRTDEVLECTFRPRISRNSQMMALQKGYGQITFPPASDAYPSQPRRHPLGSEEDDDGDDEVRDRDAGSILLQQDPCRHYSQHQQDTSHRSSSKRKARDNVTRTEQNSSGVEVPVRRMFDAEVGDSYLSALSSEIQGILSQWAEVAEQERATI